LPKVTLISSLIYLRCFLCTGLELDPSIFYPIAACPYLLFPGEKKPISKLLSAELPLKVDIEHEYVPLNPEIGPDGEPVKKKVTIPFAELDNID